jgi:hypothetical protein
MHGYGLRPRKSKVRRTDKLLCACWDALPGDVLRMIALQAIVLPRHGYRTRLARRLDTTCSVSLCIMGP